MSEVDNPKVELTDENGQKAMFQELERIEHKGHKYGIFCPAEIGEDQEEVDVVIMQYLDDGVSLQMLEDEALCDEVFEVFSAMAEEE